MALALADSLIECRGFEPRDQMRRYCQWWFHGRYASRVSAFGIGTVVRQALEDFEFGSGDDDPYRGPSDPLKAGNGCTMRLAPVPMLYVRHPVNAQEFSVLSSRTTHSSPQCLDACWYFGGLLVGALRGVPKEELLTPGYAPLPGGPERAYGPEMQPVVGGSFLHREPPEIKGTGYVVDSLEAALWAFSRGKSFEEGALRAVNLRHDAATARAIYGQLAGAYYGESNLPLRWRAVIVHHDMIITMADKLLNLCERIGTSL